MWVYEPDKTITYAGRSYMEPATITSAVARRDLGPLQSMNARRRGMELFISESQLDKPSGDSPTVVLLRRDDGRYELYGLSGGP